MSRGLADRWRESAATAERTMRELPWRAGQPNLSALRPMVAPMADNGPRQEHRTDCLMTRYMAPSFEDREYWPAGCRFRSRPDPCTCGVNAAAEALRLDHAADRQELEDYFALFDRSSPARGAGAQPIRILSLNWGLGETRSEGEASRRDCRDAGWFL